MPTDTIPSPDPELKRLIMERKVAPVLGAGVSAAAAHLPSWNRLLSDLAARLRANGFDHPDLAALESLLAANRYEEAGELIRTRLQHVAAGSLFANALREMLDVARIGIADRTLPEAIWRLKPSFVLTTNYDHVLELTGPSGLETVTWKDWRSFAIAIRRGGAVIHLHGVFNQPETVVFSVSDYGRLNRSVEYRELMKALWMQHTFLFIGSSHEGIGDLDFSKLWAWAKRTFQGFPFLNYILLRSGTTTPEQRRQLLTEYRVQVVEFGADFSDLPLYLNSLTADATPSAPIQGSGPGTGAIDVAEPQAPPKPIHLRELALEEQMKIIDDFLELPCVTALAQFPSFVRALPKDIRDEYIPGASVKVAIANMVTTALDTEGNFGKMMNTARVFCGATNQFRRLQETVLVFAVPGDD